MNFKMLFALLILAALPASSQVILQGNSGGGVQVGSNSGGSGSNWGAGKTLAILFGSRGVVSSTYIVGGPDNDYGTVTASSVSGSTITMTASNSQVAGNALVLVSGFSSCPALIGQTVIVSATGLTTSSLEATNVTGVSSGSCGAGVWAGRDTAAYDLNFTSNVKGAVVTNYSVGGGTAAAICPSLSSYLPSVTADGTHWVAIGLGDLDADNIPAIESNLQTCWAGLHALGYKVIASTIIPIDYPYNIANPNSYQTAAAVSNWMIAQGPGSSHIVSGDGQYWDGLADAFSKFRDPHNSQLIMQFGCTSPCTAQHLSAAGNLALAGVIDTAAGNLQNPGYPQPSGQSNLYIADVSGLSTASDYIWCGNDNGFGVHGLCTNIVNIGSGLGVLAYGMEVETQDNLNIMDMIDIFPGNNSATLAFVPPSGGFPTVGLTADSTLPNTVDVTLPGGAPNTHANIKLSSIVDTLNTVNGSSTVNGPSSVNGGETVLSPAANSTGLVLKGRPTGAYVLPIPSLSAAAAGNITVPGTVPAGSMFVVSCIHSTGDTVTDGIGGDANLTQVATISIAGFTDLAVFALANSVGGSATISGCHSYWNTVDVFTGGTTTLTVDGTPSGNGIAFPTTSVSTGNTSPTNSGLLYTVAVTSSDHGILPFPAPSSYGLLQAGGSGYHTTTAWSPYTAGTYSATWDATSLASGDYAGAIIVAFKGISQTGDTGDHLQNMKSDGTLQGGVTGAGDVFVINTSAGLILKDTVAGTCSRIQLTSGVLVPTVVTCPN